MADRTKKRKASVMMINVDPANVFAIPEFWPASKPSHVGQLPQDDETLFFGTDEWSKPRSSILRLASPSAEDHGFFKLPPPESHDKDQESVAEEPTETGGSLDTEQDQDMWMELEDPVPEISTIQTWESFMSQEKNETKSLLITEAGTAAYDALLAQPADPTHLQSVGVPVINQSTYLQSLLALSLGRESVLFKRGGNGYELKPVLPKARMPGYSAGVLQGLEKQCRHCGRNMSELNILIRQTYSSEALQCQTALASVLDDILRTIQQHAIAPSHHPRSLLQLRHTVQGVTSILRPVSKLASKLERARSDEEIISYVFEQTSSQAVEPWLQEIFQIILCRVSGPWIDFLEEWLGTRHERGVPFLKTEGNIDRYKGFVKVASVLDVDEVGDEVNVIDYCLDYDKVPPFMPKDIVQTLFEAGSNLRFIRASHPEHPLSQPDLLSRTKPPVVKWLFAWDSILELEARVTKYRHRLLRSVTKLPVHSQPGLRVEPEAQLACNPLQLDVFQIDEKELQERLQASCLYLDAKVPESGTGSSSGQIEVAIHQCFGTRSGQASDSISTTPHWSLLPVLCFGGIISGQAQIVNREMLRLLFAKHDLQVHLDLQRQFHLFGNGMFCSRLSHALFDPDVERTDRQAGVARQGGTMGLRLGTRDTWPPASSELRLALMGVLVETYCLNKPMDKGAVPCADIPGDLSFAVRDLTEEEINKCLDADSLEALDFLRLQYKTPDELRCIISPEALAQYDQIFKHLLRVLRVLFVTNQLSREIMRNTEDNIDTIRRFVREANHFVSSIASYFLDTGIAMSWQAFERKLRAIEETLSHAHPSRAGGTEGVESPGQLRTLHSRALKSILSALLLRKRQEPVLQLVMEIFSIILEFAKGHRNGIFEGSEGTKLAGSMYAKLKKKIQIFVTVCRGLAERHRGSRENEGLGDESTIAQLLSRLDINSFYTKA